MFSMSASINGRSIHLENIADELERAIVQDLCTQLADRIADIADPETGEAPRLLIQGTSLSDLDIKVEGAPAVIEQVQMRLA